MLTESLVRNAFIAALLALAMLQTACGRDVIDSNLVAPDAITGSNNIYRNYELAADEARKGTVFTAAFSVKDQYGTWVRLTPPSRLFVNGRPAQDNSIGGHRDDLGVFFLGFIFPPAWLLMGNNGGASYSAMIRNAQSVVGVDWRDQQGNQIRDVLQMPSFSASAPKSLHYGEGLIIAVNGSSFERISVQVAPPITQSPADQPSSVISQSFSSAPYVRISAAQLDTLPRGNVTISIEATREETLDAQSSAGGHASMIYKHKPLNLNLVY